MAADTWSRIRVSGRSRLDRPVVIEFCVRLESLNSPDRQTWPSGTDETGREPIAGSVDVFPA